MTATAELAHTADTDTTVGKNWKYTRHADGQTRKQITARVEAECPAIYDIIDRARDMGIDSCTSCPFRPGYPGASGAIWLSDWVTADCPLGLTPRMLAAIGGLPHTVTDGPYFG